MAKIDNDTSLQGSTRYVGPACDTASIPAPDADRASP